MERMAAGTPVITPVTWTARQLTRILLIRRVVLIAQQTDVVTSPAISIKHVARQLASMKRDVLMDT